MKKYLTPLLAIYNCNNNYDILSVSSPIDPSLEPDPTKDDLTWNV